MIDRPPLHKVRTQKNTSPVLSLKPFVTSSLKVYANGVDEVYLNSYRKEHDYPRSTLSSESTALTNYHPPQILLADSHSPPPPQSMPPLPMRKNPRSPQSIHLRNRFRHIHPHPHQSRRRLRLRMIIGTRLTVLASPRSP